MKEMVLDASIENIVRVTECIDSELEAQGCPLKAQMQIDVAIDELFSNIARYAYPREGGSVTVRYDYQDGVFSITFIDRGVPYNPLEKSDPDVSLPAVERNIGGLGIFLVKKTMDGMEYQRMDGCNILTIRKRIGT